MTFTQIKAAIKDYCLLTSAEADTRVGTAINRHYRRITSQLGLDATRFVTRTQATTPSGQTVTFTAIEKLDRVLDVSDLTARRLLAEVSLHELRVRQPGTGPPTQWALQHTAADAVTILLDTQPPTLRNLEADGWTTLADLSGSDEPVFPESFHDVLVWFVISEELLKKEKLQLAGTYDAKAEKLLGDLRFHLADSPMRLTRQASTGVGLLATGGGGGGGLTQHAPTHEAGGSDPIDLGQLEGVITLAQLVPHHDTHQPGGSDALVNAAWTDVANVFTESQTIESGIQPILNLIDLTSAAGSRRWQIQTLLTTLRVRAATDTGGPGGVNALVLDRAGNASIANVLTAPGGLGTTPLDATHLTGTVPDATLSSNVALRDAANVFTDDQVIRTQVQPSLTLDDALQPTNSRLFRMGNGAGALTFDALDDTAVTVYAQCSMNRSGDWSIARDLYEKGRTTPLGHWTDVAYNAANFTVPTGTWTVLVSQQQCFAYTFLGKTVILALTIAASTITGTPVRLQVTLPSALAPSSRTHTTAFQYYAAGAPGVGSASILAGPKLDLLRDAAGTAWPAGTTYVSLTFAYSLL